MTIYFYSKTDDYFWLSNFSRHGFELDGKYWLTVEHYFQAAKFFGTDDEYAEKVRLARWPQLAEQIMIHGGVLRRVLLTPTEYTPRRPRSSDQALRGDFSQNSQPAPRKNAGNPSRILITLTGVGSAVCLIHFRAQIAIMVDNVRFVGDENR